MARLQLTAALHRDNTPSPAVKPRTTLIALGLLSALGCSDRNDVIAPPATSAARTGLQLDVAAGSSSQPGPITSRVALPNVCLDVQGGTATAPALPATLQAWQCHGGANQQFTLQPNGTITAYGGQLCVDVWRAQANDGDSVVVWPCNGGANQKWTYTAAGQLQTAVNGKCLDLWQAQGQNGAPIKIWPCNGGRKPAVDGTRCDRVQATPIPTGCCYGWIGGAAANVPEHNGRQYGDGSHDQRGAEWRRPSGGAERGAAGRRGRARRLGATLRRQFRLTGEGGDDVTTQWITVRSCRRAAEPRARASDPANAAQMAKIRYADTSSAAIATAPGRTGLAPDRPRGRPRASPTRVGIQIWSTSEVR